MGGFLSGRTSLTTVQTADIANDAITLAKLAGGTDGNIISFDASGDPVAIATGDDGQALHSAGAGSPPAFEAVSAGFTQGTEQATTSGTSITFSSIPAGVDMIVINFLGVSTGASSDTLVQIGDAGGIETSGYVGRGMAHDGSTHPVSVSTSAFNMYSNTGTREMYGTMTLTLEDAANFTWVATAVMDGTSGTMAMTLASSKSLSAELTQLQISGGTFDSGAVNIMYI